MEDEENPFISVGVVCTLVEVFDTVTVIRVGVVWMPVVMEAFDIATVNATPFFVKGA